MSAWLTAAAGTMVICPVSDWTLSASFENSHADSISRKSKHREALAFITDEQVLYR